MAWTPDDYNTSETPEQLLARFPDNEDGLIDADDTRALIQSLSSSIHWMGLSIDELRGMIESLVNDTLPLMQQQILDLQLDALSGAAVFGPVGDWDVVEARMQDGLYLVLGVNAGGPQPWGTPPADDEERTVEIVVAWDDAVVAALTDEVANIGPLGSGEYDTIRTPDGAPLPGTLVPWSTGDQQHVMQLRWDGGTWVIYGVYKSESSQGFPGMSGAFASAYSTAYDITVAAPVPPVNYVTTTWSESIDDHARPRWPPYSRLWVHYHFPETQLALLLWESGRVEVVDDLEDADLADAHILGGTVWYVPEDDWQARVLADAGFEIVPYTGTVTR